MLGNLKPLEIGLILLVIVLLFGAKKLPDAAKALGKSARILKSEAKAMKSEGSAAARPPRPGAARDPHDPGGARRHRQRPPGQ